jgi:Domain of unknown function (DUF6438)
MRWEANMDMSLHMIFGFLLALLGTFTGYRSGSCSSQTALPQNIPPDLEITLERTMCLEFCPTYKLTITADGAVVFEGRKYVKQEGATIKSAVSQEQLKQLMAEIDRVKFFSMKDDYSFRTLCAADHPSAITSIRINGKSNRIDHYLGCDRLEGPKALTELENKIDEIVNTAQWIPDKYRR